MKLAPPRSFEPDPNQKQKKIFHLSFDTSHLSFGLEWLVSAVGRFNPEGHREYVEINLVSNEKCQMTNGKSSFAFEEKERVLRIRSEVITRRINLRQRVHNLSCFF